MPAVFWSLIKEVCIGSYDFMTIFGKSHKILIRLSRYKVKQSNFYWVIPSKFHTVVWKAYFQNFGIPCIQGYSDFPRPGHIYLNFPTHGNLGVIFEYP